ncbi:MAG: acyl-CoA--6-aminopenicillanic acid acyl-transferase [Lachnospiraceae bacterium]|nr:acyl-CoA--6-aminopenicillanic acid acyl-transferase [Lachnospiraceae bacterium]
MYHLRLKGGHYEMGVKRGKIFNRGKISFPLQLDDFQLEHGKQSEAVLKMFFPEVCEEIRGVSDTIGADYLNFASWMLCMGCCMYNLENNIPVEIRGCTAFAYEKEGRLIYGRNNDLPPYLRDGSKSEIYDPKNGNRFNITTSSFINGEEGLNEHGLAAAMTFVMTDLKKIQAGFNSCFIVRYLLEKASNTEQAISLLKELPIASNCNILLADKGGRMAAAECTPSVKNIREAEKLNNGRIVCIVNSFTSDEMKPYNDGNGNDYESRKRYGVVMDSFSSGRIKDDYVETTKQLLRGDYGFMCQYDNDPDFETVWSSIFDLKSLAIYRAEGDPRREKFVKDNRLQHPYVHHGLLGLQGQIEGRQL